MSAACDPLRARSTGLTGRQRAGVGVRVKLGAVRADADRTGGRLGVTKFWAARGHGSPMIVHTHEDEGYLVIEGELEWRSGDEPPVRYGPGGFAWAPRGLAHAYTVSSATARFLCLTTPGGLEAFFRRVGQPVEADGIPAAGSVTEEEAGRAMATAADHGVTVVGPPPGL